MAYRDLGEGSRIAAEAGAYVCFEDEAGQNLRPPKARTWGRRGNTPVVRVSGRGSGRVSMAGLVCVKPGHRGHLFYRLRIHRGRKGERRSLSEDDYATLITAAHHQLHPPIVLVWDNINTHVSAAMRQFIDAHTEWRAWCGCPPRKFDEGSRLSAMPQGCLNQPNPASASSLHRPGIATCRHDNYRPQLIEPEASVDTLPTVLDNQIRDPGQLGTHIGRHGAMIR